MGEKFSNMMDDLSYRKEAFKDVNAEIKFGTLASGHILLNENMYAVKEVYNTISIHIFRSNDLSTAEKISQLRDGLRALAHKLISTKPLEDIDTISATSWIVTQKPKLLERLGFTIDNESREAIRAIFNYKDAINNSRVVDEEHSGIKPSHAYISKEKFLELYAE
jgi:hypothetical protein